MKSEGLQLGGQIEVQNPGFDPGDAVLDINFYDPVHLGGRYYHWITYRDSAAS